MSAVGSGGVLLDASFKSVGYPVLEITSVVMVRGQSSEKPRAQLGTEAEVFSTTLCILY